MIESIKLGFSINIHVLKEAHGVCTVTLPHDGILCLDSVLIIPNTASLATLEAAKDNDSITLLGFVYVLPGD